MTDFDTPVVRRGTDCAKWDTFDRIYGDKTLIHLGCADMDFKSPEPILEVFRNCVEHGVFGYTDVCDDFYTGIVDWYQKRHQLEVRPEEILFTPRINIACGLCIEALTRPGDRVVLNAPAYPPLAQAAVDNGRFLVEAPLVEDGDSYRFDMEALEKSLDEKTRFMILVNPHNPTTRLWTYEELKEIAALCARHELYLFCDEIHGDFVRKGAAFHSMLECRDIIGDRLIVASSPAKTFNVMGALVAYLIVPNPKLRQAFTREIQRIGEHNPTVFANALMHVAYQKCAPYIDELNRYIDGNEAYIRREFTRLFPKVVIKRREGTYLLWMDFRQVFASEEELMDFFLKKAHVEVYPGSHFGENFKGFVRLVLGTSRCTLEETVKRLEEALSASR